MKKTISLYYLYCMNMQCKVSIYHNNVETRLPFNAENLIATHLCACCNKPLVSAMDIEIKHMVAEASVKNRSNFSNN